MCPRHPLHLHMARVGQCQSVGRKLGFGGLLLAVHALCGPPLGRMAHTASRGADHSRVRRSTEGQPPERTSSAECKSPSTISTRRQGCATHTSSSRLTSPHSHRRSFPPRRVWEPHTLRTPDPTKHRTYPHVPCPCYQDLIIKSD